MEKVSRSQDQPRSVIANHILWALHSAYPTVLDTNSILKMLPQGLATKSTVNSVLYTDLVDSGQVVMKQDSKREAPKWGLSQPPGICWEGYKGIKSEPEVDSTPCYASAVTAPETQTLPFPSWFAEQSYMTPSPTARDGTGNLKTILLVDLGNVHDCLPVVKTFLDSGLLHGVQAFAPTLFNGYGVNPRVEHEMVGVERINSGESDLLILTLISFATALIVQQNTVAPDEPLRVIVASRNRIVKHLPSIAHHYNKNASFSIVTDSASFVKEIHTQEGNKEK